MPNIRWHFTLIAPRTRTNLPPETHFPRELCEAALAHAVGNAAEQAYRRGDALEKRRALMTEWAAFVSASAGSS
jgi:hypothetical protein